MRLTPADVEQMTFSTALRGYDLNEVDDFLDQIVVTIRDLQDELAEARMARPTDDGLGPDESVVGRALVAAQQTADQLVAEANQAADRLLADARSEAARIVADAQTEADDLESERDQRRAKAEAEMGVLMSRVAAVRTELAKLATEVADRLDEMDAAIELMGDEDSSGDAFDATASGASDSAEFEAEVVSDDSSSLWEEVDEAEDDTESGQVTYGKHRYEAATTNSDQDEPSPEEEDLEESPDDQAEDAEDLEESADDQAEDGDGSDEDSTDASGDEQESDDS